MDFVVLILFYGLPLLLLFMFGKVMAGNRPTKLLKTFQKELGGKTRKLGDKYQLEDYELGSCKANLSIWFDTPSAGSRRLSWSVSLASEDFEGISIGPKTDKPDVSAGHNSTSDSTALQRLTPHERRYSFENSDFGCHMVLTGFLDWFFASNAQAASAFKELGALTSGDLRFLIERNRLVFAGHFTNRKRDEHALLSLFWEQLNNINGILKSTHAICRDYEILPFLRERVGVVEFKKFIAPARVHYKVLLALEEPEQREERVQHLLHVADARISLGVLLDENIWSEHLDALSDHRLLEVLSVMCEREFDLTGTLADGREPLSARASAVLLARGEQRFELHDLPSLAREHEKVVQGLFMLVPRWREEGVSEEELCEVLAASWSSFNQMQARLALGALRVNRVREPLVHPSHLRVLELVHLSEWDASTIRLFVDHTESLVKSGVEWMRSKPLVEKLVWAIVHNVLVMKKKQAIAILENHGDARLLPLLVPHREESKEIAALIDALTSSDSFAASRGLITLSESDERGALTIAGRASVGDLTAARREEEE